MHVTDGCWIDVTLAGEDFRRQTDRLGEISSDFRERREKQVSKTVPAKPAIASKAITEETRQESRVFRERDHAVADVAGRKHLQFITQTPGTAAIVGNGDDRGETFDPDRLVGFTDESFETGEKCRQSRAPADGYELLTTCDCSLLQMKAPGEEVNRVTQLNHTLSRRFSQMNPDLIGVPLRKSAA